MGSWFHLSYRRTFLISDEGLLLKHPVSLETLCMCCKFVLFLFIYQCHIGFYLDRIKALNMRTFSAIVIKSFLSGPCFNKPLAQGYYTTGSFLSFPVYRD